MHSFIQKLFLSTYSVPSIVLGISGKCNMIRALAFTDLSKLVGDRDKIFGVM